MTLLPIPLEQKCYIEITIPFDLRFNYVEFRGQEFMLPNTGDVVNQVSSFTNAVGHTVVRFEGCYQEFTVGPSPTARLEIN